MPESKPIGSMRTRALTIGEKLKPEFDFPLDNYLLLVHCAKAYHIERGTNISKFDRHLNYNSIIALQLNCVYISPVPRQ